jgi:hypothetical protein
MMYCPKQFHISFSFHFSIENFLSYWRFLWGEFVSLNSELTVWICLSLPFSSYCFTWKEVDQLHIVNNLQALAPLGDSLVVKYRITGSSSLQNNICTYQQNNSVPSYFNITHTLHPFSILLFSISKMKCFQASLGTWLVYHKR